MEDKLNIRRLAIVNESFGMGGLQRVTSIVGQNLTDKYDILYYSMFYRKNFYRIKKNIFFGDTEKMNRSKWLSLWKYMRKIDILCSGEYKIGKYFKSDIRLLIDWVKKQKIDVLIVSGPFLIAMTPYIKEMIDVKIIGWAHNNYDVYLNDYAKTFQNDYLKGLEELDLLVCLTEYDLDRFKCNNSRSQLIHNPLTLEGMNSSFLNIKNISFTGRIDYEHKGIDYLIEIAKLLPQNWTITIAGSGDKEQVERLKNDIKINNLQDIINYRGPLKGEPLRKHYLDSSIYLMTSRWEGFGLVLVEAMNFGLPIIAFSQSGSDEVLGNGKFGILVDNGNIKEMSEQIRKLTENIKLREEYQQKSLQRVKDFNLQDITAKWVELIESL